jgi:hypothetical protein
MIHAHRPSGSGIAHTMSLADACQKPRRGRPIGYRKFSGKARNVASQSLAEVKVSPETIAKLGTYGGRVAAKAGLTVDEIRRLSAKFGGAA